MNNFDEHIENLKDSNQVKLLSNIAQLAVFNHVSDASGALRSGCILLGVTPIAGDLDDDGFKCLVGLPYGVEVTPYLSNWFHRE